MLNCYKLFLAAVPLVFLLISCGGSSALQGLSCSPATATSSATVRGIRNGDPAPSCAGNSVAFMRSVLSDGEYYCSGVLIRSNVVLTAGHCVSAGNHTVQVTLPGHPSVTSTRQAQHPGYQTNGTPTAGIDIGLVYLSQSIAGSTPLTLSESIPTVDTQVTAMGYGLNGADDGDGKVGSLLQGSLGILSILTGTGSVNSAIVAHANTAKSQETCDGDSGGPLIYQGQVIGILSGGNAKGNKCTDSTDSSYTAIAVAMPWINSKIAN